MKRLILIAFVLLIAISCSNVKCKKQITDKDVAKTVTSTIVPVNIVITTQEYSKINKLSQAARDVALYFLSHRDKWSADNFTFSCGKYDIWTANGYDHLELYRPVEYPLEKYEKDYFWALYKLYQRKDMRLYKYEEDKSIKIIIKE